MGLCARLSILYMEVCCYRVWTSTKVYEPHRPVWPPYLGQFCQCYILLLWLALVCSEARLPCNLIYPSFRAWQTVSLDPFSTQTCQGITVTSDACSLKEIAEYSWYTFFVHLLQSSVDLSFLSIMVVIYAKKSSRLLYCLLLQSPCFNPNLRLRTSISPHV